MKSHGGLACFILICGIGMAQAQQAAPTSTSAGVFTEEQAQRGAAAYHANCAGCHGEKLQSIGPQFPSLAGRAFRSKWVGKTIGEKFDFARKMMPPKAERSLGDQVYLDIVTYILRFNKIPAGDRPLAPDLEILNRIEIAAPSH
jgi:mono/diheme cytochrome c family protein